MLDANSVGEHISMVEHSHMKTRTIAALCEVNHDMLNMPSEVRVAVRELSQTHADSIDPGLSEPDVELTKGVRGEQQSKSP
jgi:uncharacterized protein (UPF0210 family)